LWKGISLALVQAGVPLAFARSARGRHILPAGSVAGLARACGLAAGAALLLWAAAKLALRFVPATGEAPIEAFVAAPSGMLCVAALGVILPVGEELFFRGLLFRALLDWTGRASVTAGVSWLLFVLLHAQQSWGNWGGLISIATAGALLTVLRSVSGSVWLPALAHVLYNVSLSAAAVGLL
jgi:membrane protease YdiL (CAAX protease family)